MVEAISWVAQILSFTAEKREGWFWVCVWPDWLCQSKPGHKLSLYRGNIDLGKFRFIRAFRHALNVSEIHQLTASCFESKNLVLKQEANN